MEIKNKELIELLASFKEDLKKTVSADDFSIASAKDEIDELFEFILMGWLDGGGLVGFSSLGEVLTDPDRVAKEYEDMYDFDDDPDQAYADAWQAKLK